MARKRSQSRAAGRQQQQESESIPKKPEPEPRLEKPSEEEELVEEEGEEEEEEGEEEEDENASSEDEEEEENDDDEGEEEEVEEEDDVEGEEEEGGTDDEEEEEEEDEEESRKESIRKLLEPFSKDQLIGILKEAALADPAVFSRISSSAESDTTHRKIFVYGLGWDVTSDTLRSAFTPFDDVVECSVIYERTTGRSKGYGFVLLRTRAGAKRALEQPQKRIGSRVITCQLASTGPVQSSHAHDPTLRKIFVNNVGPNIEMESLRRFFSQFGEIEEGPLGYDRATGKLRGFAIFIYRTAEACRKALEEPTKYFEGCQLHCQPAVENPNVKGQLGVGGIGAATGLTGDLALTAALLGQNLGAVAGLGGQGAGIGGLSPALGAAGLSSLANQATTGLGLGAAAAPGANSISPTVFGNYNSQLAAHGLGPLQSSQYPHSASLRSQTGLSSGRGYFPPYYGR